MSIPFARTFDMAPSRPLSLSSVFASRIFLPVEYAPIEFLALDGQFVVGSVERHQDVAVLTRDEGRLRVRIFRPFAAQRSVVVGEAIDLGSLSKVAEAADDCCSLADVGLGAVLDADAAEAVQAANVVAGRQQQVDVIF